MEGPPIDDDWWKNMRCLAQGNTDKWYYRSCTNDDNACACTKSKDNQVHLRGLCPDSMIDTLFEPQNLDDDLTQLVFRGIKQTTILFDPSQKVWVLRNSWSNTTGVSTAQQGSYAMGLHSWQISGDQYCNQGQPYTALLKLTACKEGQFTCNDGICISMDKRCDQRSDCVDSSDELRCNMIDLKPNYKKTIPPSNASVYVSLDILKLVNIEEVTHSITIQFQITLEWRDERMLFYNLKNKSFLNKLDDSVIKELWLPKMIYENTDQKESTRSP